MSEIIIALLLIVPVLLVIGILSYSHKKKKQKQQHKLSAYIRNVTGLNELKPGFKKHFVHQLVLIDSSSRKILVVNHHENLSHELLSLDYMKSAKVVTIKETIRTDDQSKKTEVITTQIGVEICFHKPEKEVFLIVYDHIEHNIFQMADLETEARELHKFIIGSNIRQLAV